MSSKTADELVEEVDADGTVVRVVTRAVMRAERLRHRCTYIGVVSVDGTSLLVHQRSFDKDVFPGWWDVVAGGVCAVGEPWDVSAERELAEELGVTGVPLVDVGGGTWTGGDASTVGRVFVARHDGPFTFADGEVIHARFMTWDEVSSLVRDEQVCPDSVELALPLVRSAVGW
ncbi:MAG TPA: NUDIX domain-containing protein [Acidimicrobiales bacterium]|nr:NUDIX domain-containing protein [Acidimicrobiales bacterium]